MPVHVRIDKNSSVLYRTLTGLVTVDDMIASFHETLQDPDYRAGMNSLTDLSAYAHQNSTADMRRLADFFIAHSDDIRGAKAAIVVSLKVSYGMVRILQAYLDVAPVNVEIFYDLQEAERWLGIIGPVGAEGLR